MLKAIRTVSVVMLICCMALIFSLSSENSDKSTQTSNSVIILIVRLFHPDFDLLDSTAKAELIAPFSFIVRKTAHFTVYALLGLCAFLSVFTYRRLSFHLRFIAASGICLLYSAGDELHQRFVPGRSGEIRDVCIDFCGSLLAITVLALIARASKKGFFKKYFGK